MSTDAIKPQDLTIAKFLALFNRFTRAEQVQIAQKIWKETFAEQWSTLDAELPDVEITEDEILQELMAIRYGEAKKN